MLIEEWLQIYQKILKEGFIGAACIVMLVADLNRQEHNSVLPTAEGSNFLLSSKKSYNI